MHVDSQQITIFLLELAILLGGARAMGELARRLRQPAVLGEIIAGVLLGETVLGWLSPEAFHWLFPRDVTTQTLLRSIELVGLLLLLFFAGLEIDLRIVRRQGRLTILAGISSVAIPFILGFLAGYAFPELRGAARENWLAFSLFLGTALSISAIPVIVRILRDLNLFKSDLGMLIMGAAILSNFAAWLILSLVMGIFLGDRGSGQDLIRTLGLTAILIVFCLVIARRWLDRLLGWVQSSLPWPGGVLTMLMVMAFLGSAVTEAIGIQAIFGAFIAGVMIGESPRLRQYTRELLREFVDHVFAPIVFAAPMIYVNFLGSFRYDVVLGVLFLACVAKLAGSAIGARAGGLDRLESFAVGIGLNARGEMGIILAVIARRADLIDERMFVALVFTALATSLMTGPLLVRVLRALRPYDLRTLIRREGFIEWLKGETRRDAIRELSAAAEGAVRVPAGEPAVSAKKIFNAVWEREETMGTGIGDGVAVPHGQLEAIAKPCVLLGRSREGIDFDAPDGTRARLIFLLLTPRDDQGAQVQILANIARTFHRARVRTAALRAENFDQLRSVLDKGLSQENVLRKQGKRGFR
jgi:Kef-type K+ transport system membrane component KefB/mannitol/fructose-specific phosphotransferase system IIA component (Ntr-type)